MDEKRRRPSGSKTRQRGGMVSFRASEAERAALAAKAETAGVSLGAYIRTSTLAAPVTRGRRRPSIDRELLARAVAQLGRIGGSLQQIAKRLNFGQPEYAADIPAALEEFRQAVAVLMQAAGRVPRGD